MDQDLLTGVNGSLNTGFDLHHMLHEKGVVKRLKSGEKERRDISIILEAAFCEKIEKSGREIWKLFFQFFL